MASQGMDIDDSRQCTISPNSRTLSSEAADYLDPVIILRAEDDKHDTFMLSSRLTVDWKETLSPSHMINMLIDKNI